MAGLQPRDKVEWRAGDTPASSHLRKGVVKEVLPGGTVLVRTKVEGGIAIEEIRAARLRKSVEATPAKKGGEGRAKKAKKTTGRGKKAAKKGK